MVATERPRAAKGLNCPLHKKDMSLVCHKCPWWTHLQGTNPNSGDKVNEWSCAISWLPMMLVENSQQTRQAGAAIETFRNVVAKGAETIVAMISQARLPGA